jgi:hypothetical protein
VLLAQAPVSSASGPVASVLISNGSGAAIYLGGAGVTSSNGSVLAASTAVTLWLFPGDAVYAITASSTSTVGVLQT